jgi:hypothetical protein
VIRVTAFAMLPYLSLGIRGLVSRTLYGSFSCSAGDFEGEGDDDLPGCLRSLATAGDREEEVSLRRCGGNLEMLCCAWDRSHTVALG